VFVHQICFCKNTSYIKSRERAGKIWIKQIDSDLKRKKLKSKREPDFLDISVYYDDDDLADIYTLALHLHANPVTFC
jgi:hypothetical protein